MATYIADYEDCMLLLFNGDKQELAQRKAHKDERLALLEKGDKNSPMHKFCQAGIYLHWAFVDVRFGEDLRAAMGFRKSFLLLKENKSRYPQFEYNDIFFSMEEAVVGAIPDNYKWLASIFGMRGNVKHGIGGLEKFVNTHSNEDFLYNESVAYLCYLKYYLSSQQDEVWSFLNSKRFVTEGNVMNSFMKANLALNSHKADVALQILREIQEGDGYNMFPIFDYEMGCALQMKLDDDAITYFQRFVQHYKGRTFIKDAWQKMALQYYMYGDKNKAAYCRSKIKQSGSTQVDADKQAQRFAEDDTWPNTILLQARLLIEGGFYAKAYNILVAKKEIDFSGITDKLEYNFRLGRVYDALGQYDNAVLYYKRTIGLGRERKEYYAARAALQMALMFEKQGKKKEALLTYQLCLSIKGHDFQNSIDQQAKAGVNRLTVN